MRTLVLSLVLLVTAAPSLPGTRSQKACDGAGPYWPTATLAVTGGTAWVACKEEGRVVRVTLSSGALRSTPVSGSPIAVIAGLGAVWSLDSGGVVSRLDLKSGRVTGEDRNGRGGAVQPLDRRRVALVGGRPGGHGPADRSGATEGRRPHPGRRRACGHGLPRQAGVGDQPPRSRPRRDRHGDEPAPEARQRPGGRAGADRVGGGIALGDRPRHRPAPARPGDRRRQGDDRDRRRRHRRRRERRLAVGAGARGGGRQGAASRPWRRSGASTPARGR